MIERAWVELNSLNLKRNVTLIKEYIGSETKLLAVLKSDAYGHGLEWVATELSGSEDVDYIGVGYLEEGMRLRRAGIDCPVLLLSSFLPGTAEAVVNADLTPTVFDLDRAKELEHVARSKRKVVKVHVKIDTGLGRLGIKPAEAVEVIKKISQFSHLQVEGVYTHLATAHTGDEIYVKRQLDTFVNIVKQLQAKGICSEKTLCHVGNSGFLLQYFKKYEPIYRGNMVRCGSLIYGLYPSASINKSIPVKPVLSLKARCLFVKEVPAGSYLGYGCAFKTSRDSRIATVAVGFADGISKLYTKNMQVEIDGKLAPVVHIAMNMSLVDVTEIGTKVKPGDVVTVIGAAVPVERLVRGLGIDSTEVTTRLSHDLPRKVI